MKRTPLRKKSKNPRLVLKRKAWETFSKWIRNRDNWTCFTCDKYDKSQYMHAGHYVHKDCLDFDERNINSQCAGCNTYRHGNLNVYASRLEEKYGHGILQELEKLGREYRAFTKKELEEIIKKYA